MIDDPILEEMRRVKDASTIRDSRFRDWTTYLCALVARLRDEIAALQEDNARLREQIEGLPEQVPFKRGPGRPRKDEAVFRG